ncbi:hypothetical protein ABENE_09215 [Asticcacaulis benevestitus DSM 16100 = ATCC BAA-896]|uniref:TonB-denpendent receptor n=2 Tax=Asticcacaulis TaxID=76890 RepID=V4PVD8_9CAUL|nr:hypothetical protein ABENE_09215 [Asticcacaulis benevestitus DSM 16100 = ATCC BAA-896]
MGASVAALICALPLSAFAQDSAQATEEPTTVVVTGQRLSNANSIGAQKKATGVVNVISADDLGKLPDANVADALARIPGVNVVVNQETGEGEYVSVRGMAGTFNAYSINGVRVALTDSASRKMSMTVLPPNGLKSISVSKTLTPDLDGDAIGGAVNFVTPTAFDFKKPTVRVFGALTHNDRAPDNGEGADGGQLQVDLARKFGEANRFGIFASAYYGKSAYSNEETENDGEWEPYRWRKDSEEAIDSRSMYLPGIDLDFRHGEQKRYGGNFSLDYHGDATQLYLRGQFAKLDRTGTNDYTDFRSRPTKRLTQVNIDDTTLRAPESMITGSDPVKGNIYGYTTSQIVDQLTEKTTVNGKVVMVGDGIITDQDRNSSGYWSLNGRSGVWDPKAMQFARSFQTQDQKSSLATINAGGITHKDALTLEYDASYSYGEKGSDGDYSIGYNCDGKNLGAKAACGPIFNSTGVLWSSFDPRFPLPQLPAFASTVQSDPSLLQYDGASLEKYKQSDARTALKLDARYDLGGFVDYVKAGVKYSKSERKYDKTKLWDGDIANTGNLAQSGLIERSLDSFLGGRYYYGAVLNRDKVTSAIDGAMKTTPVTYSEADQNGDDKHGSETIYAAYALANMKSENWEVVAGARIENTQVDNTSWINEDTKNGGVSHFANTKADYSNFLPSVTAVYRQSDNVVYRGAIWTSFSRPEYGNITRGESITRDKITKEIVAIARGNPDLKPAEALNFDLSAEYYPDSSSVVSVGLFHKAIKNFIFTNGSAVNADTKAGTIEITETKNGEDAKISGVELNLIKSFEGLAAPFDGFGVEANITVQTSEAETGLDYRKGDPITFIQAPNLIYNTSLTYQKYGFEGKLSYQYQGKYIEDLRDNAVDKWVQPNKSLDLHTRYNIRSGLSVDFDVQNILDGHRYYTTKGKSPSYQKDYMEPGRNFILRFAYSY